MLKLLLFTAVTAAVVPRLLAVDPTRDAVNYIPGFGAPPTRQWSGYMDLPGGQKHLHYWFVEATDSPSTAPVSSASLGTV